MVKIAVSGSDGRMGSAIMRLIEEEPGLELSGAFEKGQDAGPITFSDD